MLRRFRLEEPDTIQAASDLLVRFGDAARLYAGGTELLLVMKEGLVRYERLINIKQIPDLNQVKLDNGAISIGALATHRELAVSPVLREHLPAFVQMENNVANIRVREVGTIGGNLCFAEPHADPGTLLLVLGAKMIAAKRTGQREIPSENFFRDAYETSLESDELLTEIRIPRPPAAGGLAYLKFGYLERPSVGVAVRVEFGGGENKWVAEARITVGCAGPAPRRIVEAETLLKGKSIQEATRLIEEARGVAGRASQAISDLHGSQEYKEHIVKVLVKRAFQQAVQKS